MSRIRIATLSTTLLAAVAVGAGAPAASSANTSPNSHCTTSFDDAVEEYRQTTFEKDADGFNALLHPDVTAIFADGSTLLGKDATAGFIDGFFTDEEWTRTLDVVVTEVEGCRSGFVLFDSVYTPSPSPTADSVPLAIGLTFTFERGE